LGVSFLSTALTKNNPKIHNDKQVTQIGSSIKEFSFTNPILLDENNKILAGHGRYLAAKELKLKSVPCIIITYQKNKKEPIVLQIINLQNLANGTRIYLVLNLKIIKT
jgi:ParB-like chromosome segregation protein Spo0J